MKRFLLLFPAILFAATLLAQECDSTSMQPTKRIRKKFFNISYSSTKLSPKGELVMEGYEGEPIPLDEKYIGMKSDWGVSIVRGRTYMFHRKPLARIISIGLDVSFLDLNYAQYSVDYTDPDYPADNETLKLHKIDYGWQIGPSVTLTPGRRFTISAYFRYAPTFSSIYYEESYMGNYSTQFRTGASFSYGVIGCGFEASFGDCKYKNFIGDLDLSNTRIKSKGYRVYLQFRW